MLMDVCKMRSKLSTPRSTAGGDYPQLAQATLEDLSAGLASKQFTSVQLVQAYKLRIDEVNDEFNAVLEVNPDAEDIAASMDKERDDKKLRGYACQKMYSHSTA